MVDQHNMASNDKGDEAFSFGFADFDPNNVLASYSTNIPVNADVDQSILQAVDNAYVISNPLAVPAPAGSNSTAPSQAQPLVQMHGTGSGSVTGFVPPETQWLAVSGGDNVSLNVSGVLLPQQNHPNMIVQQQQQQQQLQSSQQPIFQLSGLDQIQQQNSALAVSPLNNQNPNEQQLLFGNNIYNAIVSQQNQDPENTVAQLPQNQPPQPLQNTMFPFLPHQLFLPQHLLNNVNLPVPIPVPTQNVNINGGQAAVQMSVPIQNVLVSAQPVGTKHNFGDISNQHQNRNQRIKTNDEEHSNASRTSSAFVQIPVATNDPTNIIKQATLPMRVNSQCTNQAQSLPQNQLQVQLQSEPKSTNKNAKKKKKRMKSPSPDDKPLSQMTPGERRRYDRNQREQQRSQKITQQIKGLRKVLTESKVPFKQNKFSILMSVVDYINHLQDRASILDKEHLKLVNTIQQTSKLVNSGIIRCAEDNDGPIVGNDAEMLYVQGIDYKAIFNQCSFPIGVAALDGTILMCNEEFEKLTGLTQRQLESQTLFGLLATKNVDTVFRALGTLLKGRKRYHGATNNTNADSNDNYANTITSINTGIGSSGNESSSEAANGHNSTGTKQSVESNCRDGHASSDNSGGGSSAYNVESSGDGISSGEVGEDAVAIGYWSGALKRPNEHVSYLLSIEYAYLSNLQRSHLTLMTHLKFFEQCRSV